MNMLPSAAPSDLQRIQAVTNGDALYMRLDDNIKITSWGSVAGVTLVIRSRFLQIDGSVQASSDQHTPNSDRSAASNVIPTPEGWLLGLEVFATAGAPITGQVFVLVEIVRGLQSSAGSLQTLLQGYVTGARRLSYPGSAIVDSTEGAGVLRSIAGTTPAAGAELSEAVPTGARWELLAFRAQLVSNATVGNRRVSLTLDDGANVYHRVTANQSQAASLTWQYDFAQNEPQIANTTDGFIVTPIPGNIRLAAGHRIRSLTTALQAGDQWSAIRYLVREWLEPTA